MEWDHSAYWKISYQTSSYPKSNTYQSPSEHSKSKAGPSASSLIIAAWLSKTGWGIPYRVHTIFLETQCNVSRLLEMRCITTTQSRVRQERQEKNHFGTVRGYTTNVSNMLHTSSSNLHFCQLQVVVTWNHCQRKQGECCLHSSPHHLQVPTDASLCLWVTSACPQKLMGHWSALRGLLLYHLEAWIQDWVRQDTLSVIFYPYIFRSSGYGIFQACYIPGSFEGLTLSEEQGVCTLHPSLHL